MCTDGNHQGPSKGASTLNPTSIFCVLSCTQCVHNTTSLTESTTPKTSFKIRFLYLHAVDWNDVNFTSGHFNRA